MLSLHFHIATNSFRHETGHPIRFPEFIGKIWEVATVLLTLTKTTHYEYKRPHNRRAAYRAANR